MKGSPLANNDQKSTSVQLFFSRNEYAIKNKTASLCSEDLDCEHILKSDSFILNFYYNKISKCWPRDKHQHYFTMLEEALKDPVRWNFYKDNFYKSNELLN